jgi:hypothetical protein
VRVHVLKTWPEYFDAQASGEKTFEVLRRWDTVGETYLPGILGRRVTYLTTGNPFVPEGFCIMSTVPLQPVEWEAVALELAGRLP